MNQPVVSVVVPAYNHAPYVRQAVESVLSQGIEDIEILVGDDASTDATVEAVRSIDDARVTLFAHPVNRGAAAVHNELLDRATGKYVALINSDDCWKPGKLAAQVAFLEANPQIGACFTNADFIDATGARIDRKTLPFGRVFEVENRSRGLWLRHFLFHGNCFCHPSVLAHRSVYAAVGHYDDRFRQLPDFDMWVRMAKRVGLHVLAEPLVDFRILPKEANVSTPSRNGHVRTMNEHYLIALSFFDDVDAQTFLEGFGDLIDGRSPRNEAELEVEKALVLLEPPGLLHDAYGLVALQKIHGLLGSAMHRSILKDRHGFTLDTFQKLGAAHDTLRSDLRNERSSALPLGSGIAEQAIRAVARSLPRGIRERLRRL